jgi:hypothetical protein
MYDQTDQRLKYPSYLQEASQLHPSKREQKFLTTMAIFALPLSSSVTAAPLSSFAQWLHDAVGAASTPSTWTEKLASNQHHEFSPHPLAVAALPSTVQQRLLQRPLHPGPF